MWCLMIFFQKCHKHFLSSIFRLLLRCQNSSECVVSREMFATEIVKKIIMIEGNASFCLSSKEKKNLKLVCTYTKQLNICYKVNLKVHNLVRISRCRSYNLNGTLTWKNAWIQRWLSLLSTWPNFIGIVMEIAIK